MLYLSVLKPSTSERETRTRQGAARLCSESGEMLQNDAERSPFLYSKRLLTTATVVVREDLRLCISFIAHIANKGHVIRVIRGEDIDINFNILS